MSELDIKHYLDEPFTLNDKKKVLEWNVAISGKDVSSTKKIFEIIEPMGYSFKTETKGQIFYFCKLYNQILLTCNHGETILFPDEYRGNIVDNEFYIPLIAADANTLVNLVENSKNKVIVLNNDFEWGNEPLPESKTKNTVLDLGGNTATLTGTGTTELFGTYKLQNGKINHIKEGTLFSAEKNSTIIIENCEINHLGTLILPFGKKSTIILKNCNITSGYYTVATNANDPKNHTKIIIENCTIETTDKDSCPILLNVPGELIIKKSKIISGRQGILVRGGKCKIEDSEIIVGGFSDTKKYLNEVWGSGNEVPMAGIVVGNRYPDAYEYNASCSIKNTKISCVEPNKTAVYVYSENKYKAIFEYDKTSIISGNIQGFGKNAYINGFRMK